MGVDDVENDLVLKQIGFRNLSETPEGRVLTFFGLCDRLSSLAETVTSILDCCCCFFSNEFVNNSIRKGYFWLRPGHIAQEGDEISCSS